MTLDVNTVFLNINSLNVINFSFIGEKKISSDIRYLAGYKLSVQTRNHGWRL